MNKNERDEIVKIIHDNERSDQEYMKAIEKIAHTSSATAYNVSKACVVLALRRLLEIFKESRVKDIPKKPEFKIMYESTYSFKSPICPSCGCDVVNHGHGWVCCNSQCRQAIVEVTELDERFI